MCSVNEGNLREERDSGANAGCSTGRFALNSLASCPERRMRPTLYDATLAASERSSCLDARDEASHRASCLPSGYFTASNSSTRDTMIYEYGHFLRLKCPSCAAGLGYGERSDLLGIQIITYMNDSVVPTKNGVRVLETPVQSQEAYLVSGGSGSSSFLMAGPRSGSTSATHVAPKSHRYLQAICGEHQKYRSIECH